MTARFVVARMWAIVLTVSLGGILLGILASDPARHALDPTTPVVSAAARYDVAIETLADRTRTLATLRSQLHVALVEPQRGGRIRSLAGTLLYARGEEDSARREVAEAERVLAAALLAAHD